MTTFNTVTVFVDRSPDAVWTVFHQRAAWMPSFTASDILRGRAGETGARTRVTGTSDGKPYERFEETLFVERPRRYVVRLWTASAPLVANADFRFDADGSGCRLTVSIHGWLGAGATADAALLHAATQSKIEADFANLKTVAES